MFENFPTFLNDAFNSDPILIRDFYFNVNLYFQKYRQQFNIYEEYVIQDGDTPEDLSRTFYQSTKFWFLILILNNKQNPWYDWPLTNNDSLNFSLKYVTEDYALIQAEDPTYDPIDPTNLSDDIVDNKIGEVFSQMETENDVKRHIYLPPMIVMEDILTKFMNATSNFEGE